jgi:hypothetical protein
MTPIPAWHSADSRSWCSTARNGGGRCARRRSGSEHQFDTLRAVVRRFRAGLLFPRRVQCAPNKGQLSRHARALTIACNLHNPRYADTPRLRWYPRSRRRM